MATGTTRVVPFPNLLVVLRRGRVDILDPRTDTPVAATVRDLEVLGQLATAPPDAPDLLRLEQRGWAVREAEAPAVPLVEPHPWPSSPVRAGVEAAQPVVVLAHRGRLMAWHRDAAAWVQLRPEHIRAIVETAPVDDRTLSELAEVGLAR